MEKFIWSNIKNKVLKKLEKENPYPINSLDFIEEYGVDDIFADNLKSQIKEHKPGFKVVYHGYFPDSPKTGFDINFFKQ